MHLPGFGPGSPGWEPEILTAIQKVLAWYFKKGLERKKMFRFRRKNFYNNSISTRTASGNMIFIINTMERSSAIMSINRL